MFKAKCSPGESRWRRTETPLQNTEDSGGGGGGLGGGGGGGGSGGKKEGGGTREEISCLLLCCHHQNDPDGPVSLTGPEMGFGKNEFRSCVKVEMVDVLGSPSLMVLMVSVDVRQH